MTTNPNTNANKPTATPVLDALRQAAGGPLDEIWGGALGRFADEAAGLPVVYLHDDCSPGDITGGIYPPPHFVRGGGRGAPLPNDPMWVETALHLVDGYLTDANGFNVGVRAGILFERAVFEGWPDYLLRGRVALLLPGGGPILVIGQVFIDVTAYNEGGVGFVDFERIRRGLLPARDASNDQLAQMHTFFTLLGDLIVRVIPTVQVPAIPTALPEAKKLEAPGYWAVILDGGADALRAALATTAVAPWLPMAPEEAAPAAVGFFGLLDNLLVRGPLLLLAVLDCIASPGPKDKVVNLPAADGDGETTLILPGYVDASAFTQGA
jgi:hypothetical protein